MTQGRTITLVLRPVETAGRFFFARNSGTAILQLAQSDVRPSPRLASRARNESASDRAMDGPGMRTTKTATGRRLVASLFSPPPCPPSAAPSFLLVSLFLSVFVSSTCALCTGNYSIRDNSGRSYAIVRLNKDGRRFRAAL